MYTHTRTHVSKHEVGMRQRIEAEKARERERGGLSG